MKVTYTSVTGAVEEIEVSAEFGEFITISRREESNGDRRERYHSAYSLDGALYKGKETATANDPETKYLLSERDRRLYAALDTLTQTQRRRFELFADGLSYREIARLEHVDHKQVKKSIEQAQRKLQRFF